MFLINTLLIFPRRKSNVVFLFSLRVQHCISHCTYYQSDGRYFAHITNQMADILHVGNNSYSIIWASDCCHQKRAMLYPLINFIGGEITRSNTLLVPPSPVSKYWAKLRRGYHNSRTSDDIEMKLGPATKLDKRNNCHFSDLWRSWSTLEVGFRTHSL